MTMQHLPGEPAFSDWEQEAEYAGTPVWHEDHKLKGFRAHFPTAAEDFAEPYTPDPDDADPMSYI